MIKGPFKYEPSGDNEGMDHFVLDNEGNEIACAPNEETAKLLTSSWDLKRVCELLVNSIKLAQEMDLIFSEGVIKATEIAEKELDKLK